MAVKTVGQPIINAVVEHHDRRQRHAICDALEPLASFGSSATAASRRLERRRGMLVGSSKPNCSASLGRPFMFWFYWDTAWSVIISGIMFATIVAHPDAEVRETWRS
jgi:hypothetical protein